MDSKKFTIISIAIFALSLLVFIATIVLVVFRSTPASGGTTTEKKAKKAVTQNIDVGDITTQIGKAGRFYKGFVVLEVKGKKTPEVIAAKMPQIKDSIISSVSAMDVTEILSVDGKKKLKEEIRKNINTIIESESEDVVDVLFTESIVQ